MVVLEDYRTQHRELQSLMRQISELLNPEILEQDAKEVAGLLEIFAKKLVLHLAMEDQALYPTLFAFPDKKIQKLARQFMDEMGHIAQNFKSFINKWQHVADIESKPSIFIAETKQLFSVLEKRIEREDKELYPLINEHQN